MFRHTRLIIVFIVFLLVVLLLSGCYTLIGYPPDTKESMGGRHSERAYRDYDYYESPYYLDYGYYYLPYPYFYDRYSYWYRPWLYDDGYYWDDDYHYSYTPEKKPEVKSRSVIGPRRTDNANNRQQKESAKDNSEEKQNSSDKDNKSNRRSR